MIQEYHKIFHKRLSCLVGGAGYFGIWISTNAEDESVGPAPVNAAILRNVLRSMDHLTFPRARDAKMPPKQRAEKIVNAVFMLARNSG